MAMVVEFQFGNDGQKKTQWGASEQVFAKRWVTSQLRCPSIHTGQQLTNNGVERKAFFPVVCLNSIPIKVHDGGITSFQ